MTDVVRVTRTSVSTPRYHQAVHAGTIVEGELTARCAVVSMRRVRWIEVTDGRAIDCRRCLQYMERDRGQRT